MRFFRRNRAFAAAVTMFCSMLCLAAAGMGQTAGPQARISEAVQSDKVVTLWGNVHPMARPANDRGSLPDQQPVTRMHLLLQRSAEQEAALQKLMAQQLDPTSPKFHAWLTPQEFGQQFGPADSDVQAVKEWLTSQGFTDLKVNNGRTLIEFNGTAGQVRNAFRTEIHRLSVNGEEHFANMQEPKIPAALTPVVAGVVGLHNFHPKPLLKRFGKFRRNMLTGEITPLFTFTDVNGTFYAVGPADFAKIYNVPTGAFDGSGQSIAIVGQSNINIQDVRDFRTIFGLAANDPQIIINGTDPGLVVSGDEGESDFDVEWAGAVAPGATIKLVATKSTNTSGVSGVDASAMYIVDTTPIVASILSDSYGACEASLGTAGNQFYAALWQQAAAEGITVIVSAGDSGSAGCDDPNTEASATRGVGVSGLASTPYNVAMGGTDFDQAGNQGAFWNAANTSTTPPVPASAKGYIPEVVWNDSCASSGLSGCATVTPKNPPNCPSCIVAAGGGPSARYSKPSWQSTDITGMPKDSQRDLPDISLFAGDGQNKSFYIACQSDQDIAGDTGCNLTTFTTSSPFHDFQAAGGTSASAPTFAGIMALVNQKTGQRQGNVNFGLYAFAKSETFSNCNSSGGTSGSSGNTTCVFNDITKGNNSVPCTGGSTNCSKTTSGGFGVLSSNGSPAYAAGTGYDLATGLGSINVKNLIGAWTTQAQTATVVGSSVLSVTSGGSVTLTATVSSGSNSSQGPTGTVQFLSGGANLGAAATCTPAGATSSVGASCTATLSTTLSALPPGIIDSRPRNAPFVVVVWLAVVLAMLSFTLAMKRAARRREYAYAGLAFFLIAAAIAGCGGGSSGGGGGSTRSITAKYSGDSNYAASTSSAITITIQ